LSASCLGGIASVEILPGTPRLVGRVDPRAGLEVLEKKKGLLPLPGIEDIAAITFVT